MRRWMPSPRPPPAPAPLLGALALALAGLIAVGLQGRLQPIPTRSLGELPAVPPAAYVRVQGWVMAPPRWEPEAARLQFSIQDGTGDLVVRAWGPVAAALVGAGRMPRTGDWVAAAGPVRTDRDPPTLELRRVADLTVLRPTPQPLPIGALARQDLGARVVITGQIRAVRRPYSGLTLVRLQDGTGTAEVAWYESLTGSRPDLPVGAGLQITGALGLYREALQVILDDPEGWALIPWSPPPVSIAQALAMPEGHWVGVRGALIRRTVSRWELDDGTGRLEIRLSTTLQRALPAWPPDGAILEVWGALRRIDGDLRLVPELSIDLRWDAQVQPPPTPPRASVPPPTAIPRPTLSPTPRPRPTATPVPLTGLSEQPTGAVIAVEGRVVEIQGFSAGWAVVLEGEGRRLRVFIPAEQMGEVRGCEGLYPGAVLQATGVLTLYRGERELLPRRGRDMMVKQGMRPEVPLRTIGSLSPSEEGAWVRVVGQVVRAEPFSAGIRLAVQDGTGEIPVILWENVAALVPAPLKQQGARVEILGRLRLYRGQLQLIPTVPWEVRSP